MAIILWLERYSILLMLGVFLVIAFNAYRPDRKKAIQKYGHIPLDDDR